jgi:hypothetical protein
VFPTADDGSVKPSKANVQGKIENVGQSSFTVRSAKSGQTVNVSFVKDQKIYSAFGGDDTVKSLKQGQYVWIWFEGCKLANSSTVSKAGYIQIYSANPKDQPSK